MCVCVCVSISKRKGLAISRDFQLALVCTTQAYFYREDLSKARAGEKGYDRGPSHAQKDWRLCDVYKLLKG